MPGPVQGFFFAIVVHMEYADIWSGLKGYSLGRHSKNLAVGLCNTHHRSSVLLFMSPLLVREIMTLCFNICLVLCFELALTTMSHPILLHSFDSSPLFFLFDFDSFLLIHMFWCSQPCAHCSSNKGRFVSLAVLSLSGLMICTAFQATHTSAWTQS